MQNEINEVKIKLALSLNECANEPLLRDKLIDLIGNENIDLLKRLNNRRTHHSYSNLSRHQPNQGSSAEGLSKSDKRALFQGKVFSSHDIVALTSYIFAIKKDMLQQKESLFEQFNSYDNQKDAMMAKEKEVFI